MNTGAPQISERLAWEGLVNGPAALAIWAALAILAAWFLWRERYAVGRGWAATFWALRLVAFGCALWMLAGPTQLRVERTTTSQSIAIFADGSESMAVVDPPDPADAVRWALAVDEKTDDDALVRSDRLNVALGAALANCQRFNEMVDEHRPTKQLESVLTSIAAGIERASTHVEALIAGVDGKDATLADRASRIATLLDGPVDESLAAIRSALAASDRTIGEDFLVRLDQLTESVKSAQRRTQVFAADLAQEQATETTSAAAEVDGMSRREKAGRALDVLESQIAGDVNENIRIDRFRFDRTSMPVALETGWSRALETVPDMTEVIQSVPPDPVAGVDGAAQARAAASGPATNLSSVFEQLAGQRAGQSIRLAVVLSDGRHND